MTLCIAAISRVDRSIVTVSDLMLSAEWAAKDTVALKIEPAAPSHRWFAMYAGDPSPMHDVVTAVRQELMNTDERLGLVRKAFVDVLSEARKQKIEQTILGHYGLDRHTFVRHGRVWLGDAEFRRISRKIEKCTIGTYFLVAGFDENGFPTLFSISDISPYQDHERVGFHAIGSGEVLALGWLFAKYEPLMRTLPALYRCCEAKFLGEIAHGVGRNTFAATVQLKADGSPLWKCMIPQEISPLRDICGKHAPPIPDEALQYIEAKLTEERWPKP